MWLTRNKARQLAIYADQYEHYALIYDVPLPIGFARFANHEALCAALILTAPQIQGIGFCQWHDLSHYSANQMTTETRQSGLT